jgi:hypothetical protein
LGGRAGGRDVVAIVDVFTMSCRALGRGVEHQLLAHAAAAAPHVCREGGGGCHAPQGEEEKTKQGSLGMMLVRCKLDAQQRNQPVVTSHVH